MADPLVGLPSSGSFPLHLGGSLSSNAKKRRRDDEEHVAIRYAFKPVSVDASTPGTLQYTNPGRQAVLRPKKGPHQVFDVREEESKARECVLIYDPTVQTFTLHAVPTTLHLTLNRSLSGKDQPLASRRRSQSSSNSSSSVPLARHHATGGGDADSQSSNEKHEVSSIVGPSPAAPKRSKPSAAGRATTGGKSTPRKTIPLAKPDPSPTPKPKAAAKAKAAPKAKAKETKKGGGRGKAPPPPVQISGKVKSAEFIEDSDEEYGVEEEEDEFAKLVGESLAQDDNAAPPQDESDDDDDEDEDEDDELGGARLVGGDW